MYVFSEATQLRTSILKVRQTLMLDGNASATRWATPWLTYTLTHMLQRKTEIPTSLGS